MSSKKSLLCYKNLEIKFSTSNKNIHNTRIKCETEL